MHTILNDVQILRYLILILTQPSRDKYERNPTTGMPETIDWATGPNGQFRFDMTQVKLLDYDAAFIMEADNQPQRAGWLNALIDDVQKNTPFMILGSRYSGRVSFEGAPRALANHINGNAVYNVTHPLFKHLLDELTQESGNDFEAIPYDYRISQMVHEGQFGTPPEFPFAWMTSEDGSMISLPTKKQKFARWWSEYGEGSMKESSIMSNFGDTHYLEDHVENHKVFVHGLNVYKALNRENDVSSSYLATFLLLPLLVHSP